MDMNTVHTFWINKAFEIHDALRGIAAVSTCQDKKVAAALFSLNAEVSSDAPISIGYNMVMTHKNCGYCHSAGNAAIPGMPCGAIHAEIVALLDTNEHAPGVCISTLEPCWYCTKALLYAGVRYFLFYDETSKSGKGLWQEAYEAYGADKIHKTCWTRVQVKQTDASE